MRRRIDLEYGIEGWIEERQVPPRVEQALNWIADALIIAAALLAGIALAWIFEIVP